LRVLLVKLSSLGDVIHTLPVVHDLQQAIEGVVIDWVVEPAFADLLSMHPGLTRIIPFSLRQWRRERFNAHARSQMRKFWLELTLVRYDCVIDLQGLSKSALVSRLARLTPKGVRYAMANRTRGSSYEPLTRWLADQAIELNPDLHALERARWLCAKSLNYAFTAEIEYGLVVPPLVQSSPPRQRQPEDVEISSAQIQTQTQTIAPAPVVFLMGTSRADKTWPLSSWIELGKRFNAQGLEVCLVHGNEHELHHCQLVAQQLSQAVIWPRGSLVELAQRLIQTQGSVGVDSGPSHLCVALNLVHVQIYRFDTAWRTAPMGTRAPSGGHFLPTQYTQHAVLQLHPSVDTLSLKPSTPEANESFDSEQVDEVWTTWLQCRAAQRSTAWPTDPQGAKAVLNQGEPSA
jgi:heptosyltransferase I